MRNIEDIAAEEEARVREIALARLRSFLLLGGIGLGLWGWILFHQGNMGKGSLAVCVSLLSLGSSWGIWGNLKFNFRALLLGLLAAGPPLALYLHTKLPSFFWGKDPSFWLSIHAGALGEPFWSPLSYLLGQAACFLFPQRQFSILPGLTAVVLAAALLFMMVLFSLQMKNKNTMNALAGLGICWLASVSLPFWNIGTIASGLPASLGFLLFLAQKALLNREEKPWTALYLLLGLLWSVHPMWGILGLLTHLVSRDSKDKGWPLRLFAFGVGLTPYLWIWFRAGVFFPSWGGFHPFLEWLHNPKAALPFLAEDDGSLEGAFSSFGWVTLVFLIFSFFLWVLNFFKWKTGNRSRTPASYFWIWALSGAGAFLFYSPSSGLLGPVAPAFLLVLGEMTARWLERGTDKKHPAFFAGLRLSTTAGIVLALGLGLVFLPGQHFLRGQYFFPQQHGLNLLRTAEGHSILVCEDTFEAAACREVRMMEPLSPSTVILEKRFLNQKWYLSQCIDSHPEILFSGLVGSADGALKSLVLNNQDDWMIHWAVSVLPPDWNEPQAFPTVLTQEFEGKTFSAEDAEKIQYRLDLTGLPQNQKGLDNRADRYFSRYVRGFTDLGKQLMDQGHYMASIAAFDRALKLDPVAAEPQSFLTQMYSKQNILEAAQLELEKTIQDHPQKIEKLMTGLEQAQKEGDESKSVTFLDEMIRLNTELSEAQYQLSVIYGRQGKTEESKSLLESSVLLNPKLIEAQLTMGHLMARMGNRVKAEEAFRAVLVVNPENKEAQVELWKLLNK